MKAKYEQCPTSVDQKEEKEQCEMHLEQVQVIFRHGARTPIKSRERLDGFANLGRVRWDKEIFVNVLPCTDIKFVVKSTEGDDLSKSVSAEQSKLRGGCVAGQLTTVGQQDAFDLGKRLESEYIGKHKFISPVYDPNEVYIRSTNSQRTITSAAGVMAGLYGKENLTETITIYSKTMLKDELLPNFLGCRKLKERFLHLWKEHKHEQDSFNIALGVKEGVKPLNFIEILDVIRSRQAHGLFLPQILQDNKEAISRRAIELQVAILGSTNADQLKQSIGAFIVTLCSRINEAISGDCQNKMLLYSCHDTTLISLLLTLGIFDGLWPQFAANIIIELHRNEAGDRFIRILYNHCVVILDADSGEFLPVAKFMKSVGAYLENDLS